ncbi:MAG TPA: hypothetical protein VLM76_13730 [Patescibacteria group bacterium]|nr:hypothetical protein [Patescibacteria group bacterium]
MNWLLWAVALGLLVALVALHVIGARGLRRWGVRPSGAVLVLRAVNVAAAILVVAFAFWSWVS